MILAGIYSIYLGGVSYHLEDSPGLPRWGFFMGAVCFWWFSWFDIMDGQRARRLKCGSCIGRIIDEAGDVFMYTWASIFAGYILRLPPGLLNLSYATVNLAPYCMEIKFLITGSLQITSAVDEFGPVEIEVVIITILMSVAYLGNEGLEKSPSFFPDYILLKHVMAALFVCLQMLFALDNIVGSLKKDALKTFYFLIPPCLILLTCSVSAYLQTETYTSQFVLFVLLHSLCFNVSYYRLMVANMTNSHFRVFSVENLVAAIPIMVHLTTKDKLERAILEPISTVLCIVLLYLIYYLHIIMLSRQYLSNNSNASFWFIKDKVNEPLK